MAEDAVERRNTMVKNLLIVVDPQIDFVSPEGALSIAGAGDAVEAINSLLSNDAFGLKIATMDWHPAGHVSFASANGAELFTKKETMQGIPGRGLRAIEQTMWPNHCVAGTRGAEISPLIESHRFDVLLRKGAESFLESYSVFEYVNGELSPFFHMVDNLCAKRIYVCGYALDYCVLQTALSALKFTSTVVVVDDACKAVDEKHRDDVLFEMIEKGIEIESTSSITKNLLK
jgi:nicotinamidase/pyrazinamidase